MKVTHFQVLGIDKDKNIFSPHVIAKCWILLYENGCLHSFNYDDIYDNVFFMLEKGIIHYLTSVDVVATETYFPDVFSSCINSQCQQKYIFKK